MSQLRVLVACEFSGTVRDAFTALGWHAVSCDLYESETPGLHHCGDVNDLLLPDMWDLLIAHPPCTYLSNSGVRWLSTETGRYYKMLDGVKFFKKFLDAPVPHIAIENPIMHGQAKRFLREQDQVVQPYMFGDGEMKGTCLWLKNLPLLQPTDEVEGRAQSVHLEPPGPDRQKNRSRTFSGVARAMAHQWTQYILRQRAIPETNLPSL